MPDLETPDGQKIDAERAEINAKFGAAMNDDAPEQPAPPRRQRRPAAELAAAPESDAPRKRGRPPKDDKTRAAVQVAAPVKDDYTADATELVGSVWLAAAIVPVTQPYALVIESNADALAGGLAAGAKHNATIRAWVSAGESSWMLGLASVALSMGMQAWQLARDKELRAAATQQTRESLKKALAEKGFQVPEEAQAA